VLFNRFVKVTSFTAKAQREQRERRRIINLSIALCALRPSEVKGLIPQPIDSIRYSASEDELQCELHIAVLWWSVVAGREKIAGWGDMDLIQLPVIVVKTTRKIAGV
jgi:hypothetical protein